MGSTEAMISMAEDEETTPLNKYVIGPMKFVVFLLTLAFIAKHDECDKARAARRMPRRGRIWIKSRSEHPYQSRGDVQGTTSTCESKNHGVLHSFQSRMAALEVRPLLSITNFLTKMLQLRDAFHLEEALTTSVLLRALLCGTIVIIGIYLKGSIW